ncbi:inner membrane peptidase. Serine peptidase. MEROPS family S49 [Aeromonas sp. RU39B]|jgi:serine protease SohB|nr:inner membrane peptidase. Serine peptidase. MEROPS family S49 [Aeromonas sp. RU39B]
MVTGAVGKCTQTIRRLTSPPRKNVNQIEELCHHKPVTSKQAVTAVEECVEFLSEYGLFVAKTLTLLLALVAAVVLVTVAGRGAGKGGKGQLEVTDLGDELDETRVRLQAMLASKDERKALEKQHKQEVKARKGGDHRSRLFVIDFKGGMEAREVAGLREEVSAILAVATPQDEVLVRLESGGGVVHGYGLCASQLQRLREHEIPLTVAVDKVAASGGYMMACVADRILAAPFAIVGSIGVVAQLPNFHKLLKKHDIEFEMHTAGQYKRTLTVFGENDDEGRAKFREELAEIHERFKQFVGTHRPQLDIDKVTTGEHWLASQALELGLVDELKTSDDYLLAQAKTRRVLALHYRTRKGLLARLGKQGAEGVLEGAGQLLGRHSPWQ